MMEKSKMKIEEGLFESGTLNLLMSGNFEQRKKNARTRSTIGIEGQNVHQAHLYPRKQSTLDFRKIDKSNPRHPRQKIIKLID